MKNFWKNLAEYAVKENCVYDYLKSYCVGSNVEAISAIEFAAGINKPLKVKKEEKVVEKKKEKE